MKTAHARGGAAARASGRAAAAAAAAAAPGVPRLYTSYARDTGSGSSEWWTLRIGMVSGGGGGGAKSGRARVRGGALLLVCERVDVRRPVNAVAEVPCVARANAVHHRLHFVFQ